jgi:hypothetical protein
MTTRLLASTNIWLLSHCHGDHFHQGITAQLRGSLTIITTTHAKSHLALKEGCEAFTAVHDFDGRVWGLISGMGTRCPRRYLIKVACMPGKRYTPKALDVINDIFKAVRVRLCFLAHKGEIVKKSLDGISNSRDEQLNGPAGLCATQRPRRCLQIRMTNLSLRRNPDGSRAQCDFQRYTLGSEST